MKFAATLFRFAALCAVATFAGSVQAAEPAIAEHTAAAGAVKLHYLQAGDGKETPVVLLHGFGENSHMWAPLIPKIASRRIVIAPDLRGAGASDKPKDGYDKKTMAQDIHALVKSLGIAKIRLVGHDIGLMVAYAYAAQYPDEVESIVLMEAFLPGVGDWTKVWLLRDLWHFHFYGETPLQLVSGRERIYLEHFWNDFAADRKHSLSETDRVRYAAAYAQPNAVAAGMEWFRNFEKDAADFAEFAKKKLPMPMLVLSGEKAGGQFLIDQGRLVDDNVQGVVVKGAGHWLIEEAPDQVIPALVTFLDR